MTRAFTCPFFIFFFFARITFCKEIISNFLVILIFFSYIDVYVTLLFIVIPGKIILGISLHFTGGKVAHKTWQTHSFN